MSEPEPRPKDWKRLVLLIALALIGLSYWNAIPNAFVYDDHMQVVRNPLIKSPSLWGKALTSDVWAFKSASLESSSNYYRPVFTAWSIANFAAFRYQPAGWHATNILLHALATYLCFLVLVRMRAPPAVTAVVTWIFAAHPVHVESVTWIAGSPDPLMAIFLFFSLWTYLRTREASSAKGWALALASMFLAMGSKESSVMFVCVIFIAEWSLSAHESRSIPWKRAALAAAPFLAVALAFFLLRWGIIDRAGVKALNPIDFSRVLVSIPQALAFYLRQAIVPYELSTAYPVRALKLSELGFQNFYAPLAIVLAVGAAMIALARKSPIAAVGAAFTLILAPSLYFRALHYEHMVRDRYFYLPLFGLFVVLVFGLHSWLEKSRESRFRWSPLTIGGLAVSILFAWLSMAYNPVWKDDVALWSRGVETDPNECFARMNLAEAYRMKHDYPNAIRHAKMAHAANPNAGRALAILGLSYRDAGDRANAEVSFKKAIATGEDTTFSANQLGELLTGQGRGDEAIQVYEAEIARTPGYKPKGRIQIALVHIFQNKPELAIDALESIRPELESIKTPEIQRGWYYLGELYSAAENREKTIEAYTNYLRGTSDGESRETDRFRNAAQQVLDSLGG